MVGIDAITKKYNIKVVEELKKGFSEDKKFVLKNCTNNYILRLSKIEKYEFKKKQYELLNKVDSSINCTRILEFGVFNEKYCYYITTMLDGTEATEYIKNSNDKEAYLLGVKAGENLRKWHNTKIDNSNNFWYESYIRKKDRIVKELLNCGCTIPSQDKLLRYYNEKSYLMKDRPIVFCHGDFHLGNMLVNNHEIAIIDVVNSSLSDPYEEFKRGYWNAIESEIFQTGLINGYFNSRISNEFFEILKYYSVEAMITYLLRSIKNDCVENSILLNEAQIRWWGNFDYDIPTWYKGVNPV